MLKQILYSVILSLALLGCGTENPFGRGEDFDDGTAVTPGPGGNVSFATNIKPVLKKCTSCHSGGTGGWTYDGGTNAYMQATSVVDADNPENSLLLLKGTGKNGHGGGAIFSITSDDYKALLAWIQGGVPEG